MCELCDNRSRGDDVTGEEEKFDQEMQRVAEGSFFNPGLESMPVWNLTTHS